jgi:hypothetical protein
MVTPTHLNVFFVLFWRKAPQQKLRTHRSLKASCATLDEDERKMISFLFFSSNGAPVE